MVTVSATRRAESWMGAHFSRPGPKNATVQSNGDDQIDEAVGMRRQNDEVLVTQFFSPRPQDEET
jgi:hypothetical protein